MGGALDFSRTRERSNTNLSVYQIIAKLQNPNVRLPDNSAYKVNDNVLGKLYAFLVENTPLESSPAIMEAKGILPAETLQEFQKGFQGLTRSFLFDRLGEILLRQSTAREMSQRYSPQGDRSSTLVAQRSIEYCVTLLTQRQQFDSIGERLRRGAESFQKKSERERRHNYRFAEEYQQILEAFLR